ncbi:MAG: TRAP transporter substrate-binding protein DctP [Candidatus Atribacteria bacterium]|nr:TRAP transporter substrate-binding protein DctP [Candidatus Atribacteria bacterium]
MIMLFKRNKWFLNGFMFLVILLLCCFSATALAQYQYKWRLPQVHPVGSDYDLRAIAFADEVREKTDGRIDITVYSGGVLCDWVECYERVMRGDFEITMTPIAPTYDPRLNVAYYMPYLFINTEEAKKAYQRDGWVYNMVNDLLLDQGIKGLALFPVGWSGITTREEPEGWQEMKPNRMKIRVMPLKANELTWERLGYIPSTIPYAEAFSAIERGVADGESGGPPFQGYQFRDIQGVWIQYNDYLEPWWFYMNLDLWNTLTADDQKVLLDSAEKQVLGRWEVFLQEDEEYRQKMKEFGLKVIIPTDDELRNFANAIRTDVWPQLEPLMGKSLIDYCREQVGL